MLPISQTLRPWVTDVTWWNVSTFNDNTMRAHLVITVLVWRTVPQHIRRSIRKALQRAIAGHAIVDAAREGYLPAEFFNWPVVVKVTVKTDRRDQ